MKLNNRKKGKKNNKREFRSRKEKEEGNNKENRREIEQAETIKATTGGIETGFSEVGGNRDKPNFSQRNQCLNQRTCRKKIPLTSFQKR